MTYQSTVVTLKFLALSKWTTKGVQKAARKCCTYLQHLQWKQEFQCCNEECPCCSRKGECALFFFLNLILYTQLSSAESKGEGRESLRDTEFSDWQCWNKEFMWMSGSWPPQEQKRGTQGEVCSQSISISERKHLKNNKNLEILTSKCQEMQYMNLFSFFLKKLILFSMP